GVAARQRHRLVAARPHRDRARRGRGAQGVLGPCRGFRRGALDHRSGDRGGGAGRRADRRALCALSLAAGPHLCREAPVGNAQRVRWPPGTTLTAAPNAIFEEAERWLTLTGRRNVVAKRRRARW